MRLPQHDQHLELYAAELKCLSHLLARFVQTKLAESQQGKPIQFPFALMLKPCTKLSLRLLRFHNTDAMMSRRKPRRVRIEYDELLILRTLIVFLDPVADQVPAHVDVHHITGQIDQKHHNLTPTFKP